MAIITIIAKSSAASLDYLRRFSRMIERGRTVLDAGCGDGLPADAFLAQQGFAVNGIDASAQLIDLARENVPKGFYKGTERC